jgi:hypothetical protein
MKTLRQYLSPRESRFVRLCFVGFALSVAPLGAQTAAGSNSAPPTAPAQTSTSGAVAPGTTAASVTTPQRANVSPYNMPNSAMTTAKTGSAYNPNGSNPPAGTTKPKPTAYQNVNAGGGSGSGQTPGTSSSSTP